MRTVAELLNRKPIPGRIGIEVEVEWSRERPNPTVQPPTGWKSKRDGSLVNGVEFVLASPIRRNDKMVASRLSSLITLVAPFARKGAYTASTHVHLNALDMRLVHLANAATVWWLLEPYVLDDCGDERKTSRYASPYDGDVDIKNAFKNYDFNLANRYRSLNIAAVGSHGSLEYRSMRCSLDAEQLATWIKLLCRLQYDVAPVYKSPLHVLDSFVRVKDKAAFINKMTGGFVQTKLTSAHVSDVEDRAVELYEFAWIPGKLGSWEKWEEAAKPAVDLSQTTLTNSVSIYSRSTANIVSDPFDD